MADPASSAPRVLVVDDDAEIRESMRELLEEEGYVTLGAANGEQALALMRADEPPQLVFLDLMMPIVDGWEVLRVRRGDDRLTAIPVVVVTAGVGGPDIDELGASLVLRKPLGLDQLIAAAARFTQRTPSA
jgi:CheY-like chemotaxis protein